MLVDLGRNDVGRVAVPGSVKVNELMVIERYSHVMHIVSNVRGQLAEGWDVFDLLRFLSCFVQFHEPSGQIPPPRAGPLCPTGEEHLAAFLYNGSQHGPGGLIYDGVAGRADEAGSRVTGEKASSQGGSAVGTIA